MAISIQKMTVEQFEKWIFQPENVDNDYEYIGGEVVSILTSPYASMIAASATAFIGEFVYEHNLGHVTAANGAYQVAGEYYLPDVGYISKERQANLNIPTWYLPQHPDLAVEVVSPEIKFRLLNIKISNYLALGTVVWVVYPDDEQVDVHTPGKPVAVYAKTDVLDGGTILPSFKLELGKIFK